MEVDEIEQRGLVMSLQERATELSNLAERAMKSEKEAEIVKQTFDIIDNKRYSYLYELLKTQGW